MRAFHVLCARLRVHACVRKGEHADAQRKREMEFLQKQNLSSNTYDVSSLPPSLSAAWSFTSWRVSATSLPLVDDALSLLTQK